ncbi:GyrI-like domain-containing protein [Brachybacterium sp. ACRRE]|uniref:GyrI-like domain-containing protein n=1 Tax=Brachybacterium sp. ACRRE TaxID=2918184 RepID=UPI001EF1F22A|nr:GyrI-like domain-containing protein [Brachybacterium sp. ACRRE]MCG7310272.1 transcriptional regulator [Brachybacterium sp. ACRRE]
MSLPAPYDADAPVTELRIAEAPVVRTVVVSREDFPVFKLPQLMDGVFSHLAGALAERGIHPTGAAFALHHRFPVDTADLEVGFPVDGLLESPLELPSGFTAQASSLPTGRVAMLSHLGGYGALGDAWGAFMEAVGEAGEQSRFPIWELYVSNPAETKDPSTLRTDLFSLLEE